MSGIGNPITTSTGFNFGGAPTFGSPQTGFNIGTTTTSTAGQSVGFGNTQTTSAFGSIGIPSTGGGGGAGFNFSNPIATTATPTATFGGFGAQPKTTAPTTGFSFGATSTQGAFNMPTASTTTTQPSLTFGKLSTPATGLSFPANTATTTTSFNFPGFFAKATAPEASTQNTFGTTTAPTQAPSIGLGGIDYNASQPKSNEGKSDNTKIKEAQLPDQLLKTVEALKSYIKEQKTISTEISRASGRKHFTVSSEVDALYWRIQDFKDVIARNNCRVKITHRETSEAIQWAEMAQRTQETPVGLQYENTDPCQFFQDLVEGFEKKIIEYKKGVEFAEKRMATIDKPLPLSPQDINNILKDIHFRSVYWAATVQLLHEKVELQKLAYLKLRQYHLRDDTNVFADLESAMPKPNDSKISSGPTPFSIVPGINLGTTTTGFSNQGLSSSVVPWPSSNVTQPGSTSFGTGLGLSTFGGGNTLFGSNTGFGMSSNLQTTGDNFSLQKPPFGTKRNKQ